jgi:hypothetical protein
VNLTGEVTVKTAGKKDEDSYVIRWKSVIPEAASAAPE